MGVPRHMKHLPRELVWKLTRRALTAIYRCTKPDYQRFSEYGGRGIKVFPQWLVNHIEFAEYLTTLPGYDNPDLDLDRIDNNGNYEPGNLRFVTRSESNRNRRRVGSAVDIVSVGCVYGKRKVISGPIPNPSGSEFWIVECACRRRDRVRADSLRRSKMCGSCRTREMWINK